MLDAEPTSSESDGDLDDLYQQLRDLKKEQAVQAAARSGAHAIQAATQAGAEATQAAGMAGQATTMVASQAGMAAAVMAGSAGFIVGIFLGLAIAGSSAPGTARKAAPVPGASTLRSRCVELARTRFRSGR